MTKKTGVAILAILVALAAPAVAQENVPPPWVQMNVIQVDPEMVDEFMAVQREFSARAKKAKVSECYFDRGGFLFHGKVKALADAAREGGLKF